MLAIRKSIRERKGQLRDRVRPRLSNVISRNRHRVEVFHLLARKVFLDVPHDLQREFCRKDARVLSLIFLEDIRLHGSANLAKHIRANPPVYLGADNPVTRNPQQLEPQTAVTFRQASGIPRALPG